MLNTFYGCTELTSIAIPDSLISIDGSAFSGCTGLKYNEYDNAYYLGNEENPYLVLVTAKSEYITSCEININCKIILHNAIKGCKELESFFIPNSVKFIQEQDWSAHIDTLSFGGSIPETDQSFNDCVVRTLRVNTLWKQTTIPSDIRKALDNYNDRARDERSSIIYAAPELCQEASQTTGYIRATLAKNDEIVDINTQYIVSVEPCKLEKYHPVIGSRIILAAKSREMGYEIVVYEPCDMVLQKIETALESLSQKVGGVAGLIDLLKFLCEKKPK